MVKFEEELFVCVDCETTGLDVEKDRVIEVAFTLFTLEKELESFELLVDPGMVIPEESIKIHHITNEMVRGKPTLEIALPKILKIIDKHVIVGHGVGFDIEMLARAAERAKIPCTLRQNRSLDTLRMARLYGESATNSLEKLRHHFNIAPEGAHRAMSDVIVNVEVFRYLCQQHKSLAALFDVLSRPILMKVMPLGKHKGRPFGELPLDYLRWAANKDFDQDLLYSIRTELKRRKEGNLFSQATNPFQAFNL